MSKSKLNKFYFQLITLKNQFVVAFRQPWLPIFDWSSPHLLFRDGSEARTNQTSDPRSYVNVTKF